MKLIFENWRVFLNEADLDDDGDVDVHDILQVAQAAVGAGPGDAGSSISRDLYREIRASMMASGYSGPETASLRHHGIDRDEMLKRDFEDVIAADPNILGLTKDEHLERLAELSSELDDETAGLVNDYIEAQSGPYAAAGRQFGDLIGRLNTLLGGPGEVA